MLIGWLVLALSLSPSTPASASLNAWTSIGPEGGWIYALAMDPMNPNTVYAGTYGGVFKSTNGGANWSATGTGPTSVFALAIDPTNPTTLYAGTYGSGVFKSTNGGATWSAFNTGLTTLQVYALAMNSTTLYAGTWYGGAFALQHRAKVYLPLVLRNP